MITDIKTVIISAVSTLFGLQPYRKLLANHKGNFYEFASIYLKSFNIKYNNHISYNLTQYESKPLIVVSNHPSGATEAMIILDFLHKNNFRIKIIANKLLEKFSGSNECFISVDVYNSSRDNLKSLVTACKWLGEGNCIFIFPSGRLGKYDKLANNQKDTAWSDSVTYLRTTTHANILPIHVETPGIPILRWLDLLPALMRAPFLAHINTLAMKNTYNIHYKPIIPANQEISLEQLYNLCNYK